MCNDDEGNSFPVDLTTVTTELATTELATTELATTELVTTEPTATVSTTAVPITTKSTTMNLLDTTTIGGNDKSSSGVLGELLIDLNDSVD